MAKQRLTCSGCQKRISIQALCPHCGQPTPAASTNDRIVWEMGQWERSRPAPAASAPAQPARVMSLRSTTAPRATAPVVLAAPAAALAPTILPVEQVAPPAPRVAPAATVTPPTVEQPPRRVRRTPADAIARRLVSASTAPAPEPVVELSVDEGSVMTQERPQPVVEDTDAGIVLLRRRRRTPGTPKLRAVDSSEQTVPEPVVETPMRETPVGEPATAADLAVAAVLPEPTVKPKVSRRERLVAKDIAKVGLVAGERTLFAMRGRSIGHATIILTNFRLIVRNRHGGSTRWIPLDEIANVNTAWRGLPTLSVGATVEVLRFRHRSGTKMSELVTMIRANVRSARSGTYGHRSAELTQAWCDLTTSVWESNTGRLRLFIRRHPVFTLGWLTTVLPIAYVAAQR